MDKLAAAVLGAVLFLGACAVDLTVSKSGGVLAEHRKGYTLAMSAAVGYKRLPVCGKRVPPPCAQAQELAHLQSAEIAAKSSLDAAEAAQRSPEVDQPVREHAIAAAAAAVLALKLLVKAIGGRK